jgi:hypothetical protein
MNSQETAADLAVVESNLATNEATLAERKRIEERVQEELGTAYAFGDKTAEAKLEKQLAKVRADIMKLGLALPIQRREVEAARLKHRDAVMAEQRVRIEALSEHVISAADDYDAALRTFLDARQKFTTARLALVNEARTDGFDTSTVSVDPLPRFEDQPLADTMRERMQVFGRLGTLPPKSQLVPREAGCEFTRMPEVIEAEQKRIALEEPRQLPAGGFQLLKDGVAA